MLATNERERGVIGRYQNRLSLSNRWARKLWGLVWILAFRLSPEPLFFWRRWLLRLFGARMAEGSNVYPRCRVWAHWNLTMGRHSCLANDVDCYAVDRVELGDFAVVSQGAHLCAASHDIADPEFRLVTGPIVLRKSAWVAAGAFIGMGVTVGEGAVVGARAVVVKDIEPWKIVVGNPARIVGVREVRQHGREATR